jgi:DNA-binding MarR family transcriptional regulator
MMSGPIRPDKIDAVIHERARLAIVSALAVAPEMSFNELKTMLSLTDGNLSAHSRTLEEAGYIQIDKTFQGRRPLTTMRLTPKGRGAFQRYLDTLRRIIDQGSEGPSSDRREDAQ